MISIIILAAGMSTRMGRNKLTLSLKNKTIIEEVIHNCKESKANEIILVYKDKAVYEKGMFKNMKCVFNKDYEKGQSTSVKAGLEYIDHESEGVLFVLGDMPFISSVVINRLIDEFKKNEKSIIVPTYEGKRGNPVLFHRKWIKDICNVKGDKGGRQIIELNSEKVKYVEFNDKYLNLDIDTINDYKKITNLVNDK